MNSAKTIVEQLAALGKNQAEIASATGISQPTISRIASGAHEDPKLSTFRSLENYLSRVQAEAANCAQPTTDVVGEVA